MRKNVLLTAVAFFIALVTQAQITITSDITSNTTWTNDNIYTLSGGFIYVTNNATLTIEPGTIVKGNQGTLVITRGAKIIAEGTATQPIVFTSAQPAGQRNPGDWGGIIICGKAPVNDPAGQRLAEGGIDPVKGLYGGTDVNDNSGVLKYVRIEYAGVAYQPNNETNSLTMGAVGLGTTIDYVQVSYGGDDGFEWFGGTVNCKHLIVNKTVDDMFDTDYGFTGRVQFAVAVSDSLIADISGSNGFESDNDATGTTNGPLTKPIFSNISVFGPRATASSTGFNSNFKRALHLRRSTSTCTYNSVFVGFPTGLKIDGTTTGNNCTSGTLQFRNNIIAGSTQPLDSTALTFGMANWFNANGNTIVSNPQAVQAIAPFNYTAPNFLLQAGSPALTGADFSAPNLNSTFFETTSYRGAFDGTNNWTACWSNFDPQNANYNSPNYGLSASATVATADTVATFTNTSNGATTYVWNFGDNTTSTDVNPVHNYSSEGTYTVTLTATNGGCSTTYTFDVVITIDDTGIEENILFSAVNVFPNPAADNVTVQFTSAGATNVSLTVIDNSGKQVAATQQVVINEGKNAIELPVAHLQNGWYYVSMIAENGATRVIKLTVQK
jgi:PKD repeat protein